MSCWSPFDSPEEEAEYAANLQVEQYISSVLQGIKDSALKAVRDSYANCKHEHETKITQVVDGKTVTFLHCDHCANEREIANG